ncbi:glycosyltransferase family A protein [Pseudoalteromonas haloplanktis]|uniref:Glycosyltransferase family A protein n=1 Tax=Pseudoalteromonas haloplanktis TaxID=228 RepID=A0ABU1BKK9_PSEHA|nr:glycosyltransferase family A protein [Pseudoalteromonas haloplanktis]MDQ9094137.1 glycosyltransferase family A protein [Pseudoalteromonas haloplanktis]
MTLDMLFSTFDDRIVDLANRLPEQQDSVSIIICHQTDKALPKSIQLVFDSRSDIKYFPLQSKGVTKSRNFAIEQSQSDIIFFCDDDVHYEIDLYKKLIQAYKDNPESDFITFAYTKTGLGLHKFTKISYDHNFRSILKVGTIEVSCKRSSVYKVNEWFPEDMGAGSKYYLCDEPVFLSRLLKSGLKGRYLPVSIGEHPPESSGIELKDINAVVSRLYCFVRIFGGIRGRILYFLFITKNFSRFKTLSLFFKSLLIFMKRVD